MPEEESDCEYRKNCHFYSMKNMNTHSRKLKGLYCIEWPQKCAIYKAKATGKPVSITLCPAGKLQA